ncbi:MAG: enoyl-CoA hydratase/isomerase family protein [Streptosporangiaceae bacterium]
MRLDKRDGVGVIVLDNPPANAFDYAGLQRLAGLIEQARYDDGIRAVVVASESPRFFSAGADIRAFHGATPRQRAMTSLLGHEVFRKIEQTPMVFVAAIAGHAAGGGLELAMACDLRFAAEGDYTLGLGEVKLGLFPGMGGTQRLTRLVGLSLGLDMIVTGRSVTPAEARHMGLVDQLYPGREACEAAAFDYCAAVAAGPSEAIGHAKTAVALGYAGPLDAGLALEREAIAHIFATGDAAEGIAAFSSKRSARFHGR